MIDYSFIIPHRNTPDLLRKCIDSIPHREGVQIIVVDDNSDPGKVDFDHFPGVGESFTEVYLTKEGRGAGYARNVGLSHAIGKWIVFADADDFFNPCIEQAMDEYLDSEAEVIFFKGNSRKLDGTIAHRGDYLNLELDKTLETNDFTMPLLITCPCLKFVSRCFLTSNGISFNECRYANDVVFGAHIAVNAKKMQASRLQIYCITSSEGSLIKATSIDSAVVRYTQECLAYSLLKARFPSSDFLLTCLFNTWMTLYKKSHIMALLLSYRAVFAAGSSFVKYAIKAKFC